MGILGGGIGVATGFVVGLAITIPLSERLAFFPGGPVAAIVMGVLLAAAGGFVGHHTEKLVARTNVKALANFADLGETGTNLGPDPFRGKRGGPF